MFQLVYGRRNNLFPINSLCQDHVDDFFDKRNVGSDGSPSEGRDDGYFEGVPGGKFDPSVTNIAKDLISCFLMDRFDVINGVGRSGKHRESIRKRTGKRG
jgi:hypothetical protein